MSANTHNQYTHFFDNLISELNKQFLAMCNFLRAKFNIILVKFEGMILYVQIGCLSILYIFVIFIYEMLIDLHKVKQHSCDFKGLSTRILGRSGIKRGEALSLVK